MARHENKAYRPLKNFDNVEFLKEFKRRNDNGSIEIVWLEKNNEITIHGRYEEIRDKEKKYLIKISELNQVKETIQY